MVRLSANLGFLWPDRDLLARVDAAAEAGFKAVELHWPYETDPVALRERCASHGIRLIGVNAPVGNRPGDFGLAAIPGREDEFRASFEKARAYAEAAGARGIHVLAGNVEGMDRKLCSETIRKNLAWAAASTRLSIVLEPMNRRDRPHYFYSTPDEALDIMADVAAPNLWLMFDVYHMAQGGSHIGAMLEKFLPVIGHIQIAGVPHRNEPDHGEVDYAEILGAIDALGYQGWVGCEYLPRGDTDEGLAWRERVISRA